jgi:L-threonylcarbamoyladenylate synthase
VVSIENGELKLLRPGMISLGELAVAAIPTDGAHPAPGMHPRHYSPRTRLLLVGHPRDLPDRRGAYVWRKKSGLTARSVRMPEKPDDYAARLYAVLHELDHESWPWIAVEAPPDTPAWAAIRDRLQRAAER